MSSLVDFVSRLSAGQDLSPQDVGTAALRLIDVTVPDADKADFLRALARKGETASELAAFAKIFREKAIDPGFQEFAPGAIDVVGTGGDKAGGFNISTLVVFTLASLGVPVMKHGNRGVTSKCGSADLFAALGVNLEAPPELARKAMRELGYVFFFAQAYHPTFKVIGPVRKALAAEGQRTVFNVLGPLVNPGRPAHVLLGVFAKSWVPRMAEALDLLGVDAALAAHGNLDDDRGIDELTTSTPNIVRGAGRLRDVNAVWSGRDYGFVETPFEHLQGGDLATNLAIVEAVLAGHGPQGLVDTIVFNAGAALWITRRVASVREGTALAREHLLGGKVKAKIAATREFYAA
ncbi:MAG TPA: anthranilate phosphoribosyltransferase [Opitutaceae bacterium]|nr:anthranilate phosphoribosyltransferase [Opitutaceae bacterium]